MLARCLIVTYTDKEALTSRLQLLSGDAQDLVVGALDKLEHGRNGAIVARIDGQKHALNRLALVRLGVLGLLTSVRREAEEL